MGGVSDCVYGDFFLNATEDPHFSLIDHLSGGLARVFDFIWLLVAAWLCYFWQFSSWLMPVAFQTTALLGALLVLMSYSMFKVYESWRGRKKIHLFGLIVSAHLSAYAVLMGFLVFSQHSIYFSRLWLAGWILLSLIGVIGFRICVYELLDRLREKGINHKRLILIGDHESNQKVIEALQSKPWLGLEVVKVFLTVSEKTSESQRGVNQAPVTIQTQVYQFGYSSLEEDVKTYGATEVWISLPLREEGQVRKVLYDLRHSTVNIRYFPSFDDLPLTLIMKAHGPELVYINPTPINSLSILFKQHRAWRREFDADGNQQHQRRD